MSDYVVFAYGNFAGGMTFDKLGNLLKSGIRKIEVEYTNSGNGRIDI